MPEVKLKKPITDEIATTDKDLDIFAGWIQRLENPDPVLRSEAGGKGLRLYDEVARDPHAAAVLQTRFLALTGLQWEVLAADDTPLDQQVADFVKDKLAAMNLTQALGELMQAVLYGFYVSEVMWQIKDGAIAPKKMIGKHPRRFSFTMARELRLLTPANMFEGEALPPRKFISFTWGSSDNPYGSGLGQQLWWPVWFKKHGIKFWLTYLEKFGMPTAVGKYPPGTPPEQQQALLDALDAIQNETGIKIPDTMAVDLLEAARTGQASYETICEYMDRQISKAVLGQTLTTEIGSAGSFAASQTHDEVRHDILQADSDLLCEVLNNTIVRWLVDYNFAGIVAYPRFWMRTDEEQDLKPLAERDEILVAKIGLPVSRRYFYDKYDIPEPENEADLVQPAAGAPQFSEVAQRIAGPQRAVERLVENSMAPAETALGALARPIQKIVREASSLDDVRERLFGAYGDMDAAEFEDLIARVLFTAELYGRATIGQRSDR